MAMDSVVDYSLYPPLERKPSQKHNISVQLFHNPAATRSKKLSDLNLGRLSEHDTWAKSTSDRRKRRIAHVAKFPLPVLKKPDPVASNTKPDTKKPNEKKPDEKKGRPRKSSAKTAEDAVLHVRTLESKPVKVVRRKKASLTAKFVKAPWAASSNISNRQAVKRKADGPSEEAESSSKKKKTEKTSGKKTKNTKKN